MNNYSKEDKLAFKKKDYLYARQTAANVTSAVFEGKEIDGDTFLEYSNKIFDWLFQEQESIKEPPKKEQALGVLPTPTADQFKVLKAIATKANIVLDDDLKSNVLKWSVTNPNVLHPTYPSRIESVDKFVKWCEEKK